MSDQNNNEAVDPVTLIIHLGDDSSDYQSGNFLNAIDQVVGYFSQGSCGPKSEALADGLEFYCKELRARSPY